MADATPYGESSAAGGSPTPDALLGETPRPHWLLRRRLAPFAARPEVFPGGLSGGNGTQRKNKGLSEW
ncbi:MAG: hypothetical protein HC862_08955 [Scytonema sp. RU_4_4]|nr:hypothetical protein [Scytonema sp. RU_4_4]